MAREARRQRRVQRGGEIDQVAWNVAKGLPLIGAPLAAAEKIGQAIEALFTPDREDYLAPAELRRIENQEARAVNPAFGFHPQSVLDVRRTDGSQPRNALAARVRARAQTGGLLRARIMPAPANPGDQAGMGIRRAIGVLASVPALAAGVQSAFMPPPVTALAVPGLL